MASNHIIRCASGSCSSCRDLFLSLTLLYIPSYIFLFFKCFHEGFHSKSHNRQQNEHVYDWSWLHSIITSLCWAGRENRRVYKRRQNRRVYERRENTRVYKRRENTRVYKRRQNWRKGSGRDNVPPSSLETVRDAVLWNLYIFGSHFMYTFQLWKQRTDFLSISDWFFFFLKTWPCMR